MYKITNNDVHVESETYTHFMDTLQECAREGRYVHIAYKDVEDRTSIRDIKPVSVDNGLSGIRILAHDTLSNEMRNFLFKGIFHMQPGGVIPQTPGEKAIEVFGKALSVLGLNPDDFDIRYSDSLDDPTAFYVWAYRHDNSNMHLKALVDKELVVTDDIHSLDIEYSVNF